MCVIQDARRRAANSRSTAPFPRSTQRRRGERFWLLSFWRFRPLGSGSILLVFELPAAGLVPLLPVVPAGFVVELLGALELLPLEPAALPAPAPPPALPAPAPPAPPPPPPPAPPPPPPPCASTAVLSNKVDTSARGNSLLLDIAALLFARPPHKPGNDELFR